MTTPSNTQSCPDGHQCENGSLCIESKQEGRYACDCDESYLSGGGEVFSGLYCSHEATVYCTMEGPSAISTTSFCTNEGTCRGSVGKESDHLGCDCPTGYTGRHCQFIEGSEPDGYPFDGASSPALAFASDSTNGDRGGDGTGLGTVGLVIIILAAVVVMGTAFALFLRRHNQHATTHVIDTTKSSDGNLADPDGDNLVAMPTQTFESDKSNHTDDEEEIDAAQITTVDSGHLA